MNDEIEITDSQAAAKKWVDAISQRQSDADEKNWTQRSKKIIKWYRDEREASENKKARFNILWSNIETILPATYSRTPKATVSRRNKDNNPITRTASQILERSLQYELDYYPDFDETMRQVVLDRLLSGRGTAWVRFETYEVSRPLDDTAPQTEADLGALEAEMTPATPDVLERAVVDYVYWEDFLHGNGRNWSDVEWVARRVYLSKADGINRFGEEFADVPMVNRPVGVDDDADKNVDSRRAEVWEIWDKGTRTVYWVSKGYPDLLDVKPDPYGLEGFFPCPKPLYATQTTDRLTPIPDFILYQDQAVELDSITNRISGLLEALKLNGAYDASSPEIARILQSPENTLVPVENWAALSEKGGIDGAISWVPIREVAQALQQCYLAREQTKQVIYEITGLSDIIRGATKASETATAQNIKRQFGSLRLEPRQHQIAVFATELLKIKAEMMMDLYSPQTLVAMSGVDQTLDAQFIEPAIMLMKQEPLRSYQIEIAADSLVAIDEEQEKESTIEFLQAAGGFIGQMVEATAAEPDLAPLAMEMLMMGVRAFKAGRSIENAFEQFKQQVESRQQEPPQEDNSDQMEVAKMQADAQAEQMQAQVKLQIEREKMQMQAQLEQQRAQMQQQVDMARAQADAQAKAQMEQQKVMFERWKTELQEATKIQIAQIQAAAKGVLQINEATQAATDEIAREIKP